MNEKRILTVLVSLFLLTGCAGETTQTSARRHLDYFELSRVADHTDLQADYLLTTRFRLLECSEVQADLGLSYDQVLAVQSAYKTPWKEIPRLSDFIAEQKEKKQNVSEDERTSHNLESSRGISRRTADFHGQKLSEILTTQQSDRLAQLVLQVHGPVLIMVQTNLQGSLAISPDQIKAINTAVRAADREIIPDIQKFGRGFISGYGPGETEQTRQREMNDLITRLRRLITERDKKTLDALSDGQRKAWADLQGKPLQIDWSPWDLMRQPFEK